MLPFPMTETALLSIVLIVISLGLMALSAFKPQTFQSLRTTVSDTFAPALNVISRPFLNITSFFSNMQTIAELQAENEKLNDENARLRDWYQMALLLESENKSLRDLLNLKIDPKYEYISARIITGAGNTFVKSLLTAAGKEDGIKLGDAVLSGEGLAGRIVEVGHNSSRVLLVTDINSRVPVLIEDTLQQAIMTGQNNEMPQLIHYAQETEIAEGARIITSGHGGVYPSGLPVGRVVAGPNGERLVDLFAETNKLRFVRIVHQLKPREPKRSIIMPLGDE